MAHIFSSATTVGDYCCQGNKPLFVICHRLCPSKHLLLVEWRNLKLSWGFVALTFRHHLLWFTLGSVMNWWIGSGLQSDQTMEGSREFQRDACELWATCVSLGSLTPRLFIEWSIVLPRNPWMILDDNHVTVPHEGMDKNGISCDRSIVSKITFWTRELPKHVTGRITDVARSHNKR